MRSVKRPLLLLLLALFACAPEHRLPEISTTADETTPQEGGTLLRRLETDPVTLNPVLASSTYDRYVEYYLFTPLVNLDADLHEIPGLADKWEISPDGKQYTFHLNPAVTWSDGTPVRASDVVFTMNAIVNPKNEAPQIAGQFEQYDPANTKVIDDHTVVIAFKEALASQLSHFNDLVPLPEHVYGKGDFRNDFITRAVGSGPYRLVQRIPGKEILLERRPRYWGKKPYIQNILFKLVTDTATAWNAVKRGDLDEAVIPSDTSMMESTRPELQRYLDFRRFYTLNYNYVAWNNKDPILSDKRVRRALTMCVDLKSIINGVYHGTARAMTGPFTPDQWAYNPNVPAVEFDPEGAKKILASVGWLDTDGDGILDHDHKPLKLDLIFIAGNATTTAFVQLFQSELKRIGIQLNILPLDPSTLFQRVLAGNYQAAYLGWNLDPDPDPFALFHSSQWPPRGQNIVFYRNALADQLIEQGRTTFDRSKRQSIYRRFHEVLADDQPYTWTIQVSIKWAINKRVRNVKESKQWGLFQWNPGAFEWWLAPPKKAAVAR